MIRSCGPIVSLEKREGRGAIGFEVGELDDTGLDSLDLYETTEDPSGLGPVLLTEDLSLVPLKSLVSAGHEGAILLTDDRVSPSSAKGREGGDR